MNIRAQAFFLMVFTLATTSIANADNSQPEVKSFEQDNILYEIRRCTRKSSKVVCVGSVTAIENDKTVSVGDTFSNFLTKIVDYEGNEFYPEKVVLGNKSSFVPCNSNCGVSADLVKGIKFKMTLVFANVPSSVSKLSLIRVMNGGLEVKFRNISISSK